MFGNMGLFFSVFYFVLHFSSVSLGRFSSTLKSTLAKFNGTHCFACFSSGLLFL